MRLSFVKAAALAALVSSSLATRESNEPLVSSSSGTIIGHRASNEHDVIEFLGIRYAQSPSGSLRFAPPKRYVAPAGTAYNASDYVSTMMDPVVRQS
jgi:carboxylesterase type B